MIVESDYRAGAASRFRPFPMMVAGTPTSESAARPSEKKPRVETVICLKVTPDVAQHAAEIWANRRIDQKEGA